MKELGLYIHLPFCVKKCSYCNFNSYANKDNLMENYLKAIIQEIIAFSSRAKNYVVTTIYIGGGTPSHFVKGGISSIISTIQKHYNLSDNAEISIEANPNSITEKVVAEWKNVGINRVSVGLQSANDNLLISIGRAHNLKDYINAIILLKANGFNNINTDIMIGLPNQTIKDVKQTINTVLKQNIQHVSAYYLILEENTPLYYSVKNGLKLPDEDLCIEMYDYVLKTLRKNNFNRYEVSNFALPNYECKHNQNCWDMIDYVGFGAGANSFFEGVRFANVNSIEDYINDSAYAYEERQSKTQLFEEYVMLKFRTCKGINIKEILEKYNIDIMETKQAVIDEYIKLGLITFDGLNIVATDDGLKVLNQIILNFVE